MERRPGRATAQLQDALSSPLNEVSPLAPEALASAKAGRERFARRRENEPSDAGSIGWAIVGVVGILFVLWVIGLVVTSLI